MTRARTGMRGPAHPRWVGEDVGYRGAHLRVTAARGRADRFPCVECGNRATGWSLAPDAPWHALRWDPRGYAYSWRVDLYQPRDSSCHYFRDHVVRTGEVPAQIAAAAWLVGQLEHVHGGAALATVLRAEAAAEGITPSQLSEGRRRYTDVFSVPIPGVRGYRRWILPNAFEMETGETV